MTPHVELIYDTDCPHVQSTRAALVRAFARVRVAPAWTEWALSAADSPALTSGFGSPTILVDGEDVAGAAPGATAGSCRLYGDPTNLSGTPSVEQIAVALSSSVLSHAARHDRQPSVRRGLGGVLPAIGASLLPVGLCPACWPAYAGVVGSLGLGFLLDEHYQLPLTVALLLVALSSLAWRASYRRGYRPLGVGALAAALIIVAKFNWPSQPLLYLGAATLLGCTTWNSWPRHAATTGSCAKCAPHEHSRPTIEAPRTT